MPNNITYHKCQTLVDYIIDVEGINRQYTGHVKIEYILFADIQL